MIHVERRPFTADNFTRYKPSGHPTQNKINAISKYFFDSLDLQK